jgi:hypothetical protein
VHLTIKTTFGDILDQNAYETAVHFRKTKTAELFMSAKKYISNREVDINTAWPSFTNFVYATRHKKTNNYFLRNILD